jgi:hypothetical protein
MNLLELLLETGPAMMSVFELGFLPEENDVFEITPEMYASYESKGGDISKKLYSIMPKDEINQGADNEVTILTEDEIPKLWKAVADIRKHAKRAGCESEDGAEILAAAASILPDVFSENSRFAMK